MKRIVGLIIIFSLFLGCKSDKGLKFCEGKAPDGKEMNCGRVFSAGDLAILITGKESFGVDKLTVNIYMKKEYKREKIDTLTIDVKPDESSAGSDIRLYEEGEYAVEVIGKEGSKIAEGDVQIIDVY